MTAPIKWRERNKSFLLIYFQLVWKKERERETQRTLLGTWSHGISNLISRPEKFRWISQHRMAVQIKLMNLWRPILHEAWLQWGISSKNRWASKAKGLHANHIERDRTQEKDIQSRFMIAAALPMRRLPYGFLQMPADLWSSTQNVFCTFAQEVKTPPRWKAKHALHSNDTNKKGQFGESLLWMIFISWGRKWRKLKFKLP